MDGELKPRPSGSPISDADRERFAEQLQAAAGAGLLTLDEFEQRLDAVLAADTFGEVEPFVADLPAGRSAAREHAHLRTTAASLRRRGEWMVARRLQVTARAGSTKLDFTDAVIAHPVVEIELDVSAGSTTLVLPRNASVDIGDVELIAGSSRVRGVPTSRVVGGGPHFVVRGRQRAGRLVIRPQRRFWRWRW